MSGLALDVVDGAVVARGPRQFGRAASVAPTASSLLLHESTRDRHVGSAEENERTRVSISYIAIEQNHLLHLHALVGFVQLFGFISCLRRSIRLSVLSFS